MTEISVRDESLLDKAAMRTLKFERKDENRENFHIFSDEGKDSNWTRFLSLYGKMVGECLVKRYSKGGDTTESNTPGAITGLPPSSE